MQGYAERTDSDDPWHYVAYYENLMYWDDDRLVATYRRLSRDLRIAGHRGVEHVQRMLEVESAMRALGLDPDPIARQVQAEIDEMRG